MSKKTSRITKPKCQSVLVELATTLPQKVLRKIIQITIEERGGTIVLRRDEDQGWGVITQVTPTTPQPVGRAKR